ncbi:MAG: hypothetical protein JSU63_03655 [Phycisphaerales bacterium]|nr:MAG: hypothetical protein JSU63_03655 [Phycisphaerales bacterium]
MPITHADSPPVAAALPRRLLRVWHSIGIPTLADALFLVVLFQLLHLGATGFFNDPGTGWHIRTGDTIVATGQIPVVDSFSYTREGHAWVETQWVGDVLMYWGFSAGGYSLLAVVTAIVLAGLFRWIYRTQMAQGGWPILTLLITLAAACAASGHFLVRPLLASTIGIPLCFWWSTQYARGGFSSTRLWLLVPIAAVWCNVHPGVLGGIATIGLCCLGTLFEGLVSRQEHSRREMLRRGTMLLAVSATMGVVTLVNPYGVDWHLWIIRLMGMGALSQHVHEWMPPTWTDPDAIAAIILVAATAILACTRRNRIKPAEIPIILFWLSQALGSSRHLPLAGMVLALQLGRLLANLRVDSGWVGAVAKRLPLFSPGIRKTELRTGGGLVSGAAIAVLIVLLATGATVPAIGLGVAGPPVDRYPPEAVEYLRMHGTEARLFNEINFGGMLIHQLPETPVFIDDRFGLYGPEFVEEYVVTVRRPNTHADDLLDTWRIDTVLISNTAPLHAWLADSPKWTAAFADNVATVYTRNLRQDGEGYDTL